MLGECQEVSHHIRIGADSRLFWITTSRVLKALARAAWSNGVTEVGLQGGTLLGAPILLSDGTTSNSITLLDASQIAVAVPDPQIELRTSNQADVELSNTPTQELQNPTASTVVSAFQSNLQILIAERAFGIKAIGQNAVATLTGVNWAGGQDSPAVL